MSSLSEIQRDIDRLMRLAEQEAGKPLPPAAVRFAKAYQMQVQVGQSAELSIIATTGDKTLPEAIDDVPVVRTDAFTGFEVVVL